MSGAVDEHFVRLLRALGPFLSEVVFVGGWAHRLHALHVDAQHTGFEPLMTRDADVVLPDRLKTAGGTLRDRLLGEGFREELRGEDAPPLSLYRFGGDEGFFVEFLLPQRGGGIRRDGRSDDTAVVSGVSAQKLRHVDLLAVEPWTIDVEGTPVKVANGTAYLAQKILVLHRRPQDRQGRDVLYIHDTLAQFGGSLRQLNEIWKQLQTTMPRSTRAQLAERMKQHFNAVNDNHRRASLIATSTGRPNPPGPEILFRACRFGLKQVFGELVDT